MKKIIILLLLTVLISGCDSAKKRNDAMPWRIFTITYNNGTKIKIKAKAFQIDKNYVYFKDGAYAQGWAGGINTPETLSAIKNKGINTIISN
jgi:uncharacterized protein YceK